MVIPEGNTGALAATVNAQSRLRVAVAPSARDTRINHQYTEW